MSYVKKCVITAVCIALCVVLPMAFHAIPESSKILSPMHIPVLLCGLICGPVMGLLCGIAGTALSTLLTGMPVLAYMPVMIVELAAYGLISGIFTKFVYTKRRIADILICLISAQILGRVISGISKALVFSRGKYSFAAWFSSGFVKAWPALVIQIILIPAVIIALEKSHLIPRRYPEED